MPMSIQIMVNKQISGRAHKSNNRYQDNNLNDLPNASRNAVPNFNKTSKFDRDLCMLLNDQEETESDEFMPMQEADEEETKD
jgi:hypothetical protein